MESVDAQVSTQQEPDSTRVPQRVTQPAPQPKPSDPNGTPVLDLVSGRPATRKTRRTAPVATPRRRHRPVDDVPPTLGANESTAADYAFLAGAPGLETPACPECGGPKTLIPPTGFMYACRACYPATFAVTGQQGEAVG